MLRTKSSTKTTEMMYTSLQTHARISRSLNPRQKRSKGNLTYIVYSNTGIGIVGIVLKLQFTENAIACLNWTQTS